jgi:hypothetical protein
MIKISTYIFIHDENILLEFKEKNKFNEFDNLKYVFLGKKPCDKLSNMDDVIIARNLPNNIEEYPRLTSFTGWYALWKNNLIDTEYVNLFEYDISPIKNFVKIQEVYLNKNFDFIGYFPMPLVEPCYVKDRRWVEEIIKSIKNVYKIDIDDLINTLIKTKKESFWTSTSNSTFKKDVFEQYMIWFDNLLNDLKNSPYPGHAHERSISFYYFTNKINHVVTNGYMDHLQLNSHGTSPLPPNRFDTLYNKLF